MALGRRTLHRVYSAVFLLMLIGVAFFGAYSGGNDVSQPKTDSQQRTSDRKNSPVSDAPASVTEPVGSGKYDPPCDKTQTTNDTSICEERRSADAAEQANIWAERQFYLGVIGGGILLWTLLYTRRGTDAAVAAATAANKSNEVMRDAAKEQLRAYVCLDDIEINIKNLAAPRAHRTQPRPIEWDFVWIKAKNAGQTPARNVCVFSGWVVLEFGSGLPKDFSFPMTEVR